MCEANVVACFALGLACRAGVAIWYVEAARVACIPIRKAFDDIGVRGPLLQLHATLRGISWHASLWGKVVHIASTTCGWGHRVGRGKHTSHARGWGETAMGILLLRASASAAYASTPAAPISLLVGCRHRWNIWGGRGGSSTTPATTTANTLSGIAGVE